MWNFQLEEESASIISFFMIKPYPRLPLKSAETYLIFVAMTNSGYFDSTIDPFAASISQKPWTMLVAALEALSLSSSSENAH